MKDSKKRIGYMNVNDEFIECSIIDLLNILEDGYIKDWEANELRHEVEKENLKA